MFSYGLSNFRRLKAIQPIPLKPITILVGKNSSGKSSYLRSLPLLNQSITTDTAGAILWWGDFVDFGSFKETIHHKSPDKEISFHFSLSDLDLSDAARFAVTYYRHIQLLRHQTAALKNVKIEVSISNHVRDKTADSSISYVSTYRIAVPSDGIDLTLKLSPEGAILEATLNKLDIVEELKNKEAHISLNSLLPTITFRDSRAPYGVSEKETAPGSLVSKTREIIKNFYKKSASQSKLHEIALTFLYSAAFSPKRIKLLKETSTEEEIRTLCGRLETKATSEQIAEVAKYSTITNLPTITSAVAQKLGQIISNVSYIGPARVRSERYYRQQDLSVSTISPDGHNFPIFLASLTRTQIDELSDVINHLYGYKLRLKKEAGHISIFLEDDGFLINLIDTGYGLSQILPVIAQMWWAGRDSRSRGQYSSRVSDRIVAIEQPELHLHPAHQASLADAFLLFSRPDQRTKRSQLQFLIETHSESLINRLGELVYEKKISKDDIQVVVFDTDSREKYSTSAKISTFDDEGSLINWPVGFFSTR
jgi:predicted ATP-dependent endonuclease of OLD family